MENELQQAIAFIRAGNKRGDGQLLVEIIRLYFLTRHSKIEI
jgi:hypothetical protein